MHAEFTVKKAQTMRGEKSYVQLGSKIFRVLNDEELPFCGCKFR